MKEQMEKNIYIQLLGEGTVVYRPVPATKINHDIYKIEGYEIYDPDDETWEFSPGTIVNTKERELEGETVLVAFEQKKDKNKIQKLINHIRRKMRKSETHGRSNIRR